MKTGLIVYVTGKQPPGIDQDNLPIIENLEFRPDALEVITASEGHFDISDAWWSLVSRGMDHVICTIAHWTADGKICLTTRQLRLCG